MTQEKTTAGQLAARRHETPHVIGPEEPVIAALKQLAEHDIGALLVTEGAKLLGIISERDCVRKVELRARNARDTKVREVMTAEVISVAPETSVDDCMVLMHKHRIRHLPVLSGGRVSGVLSSRDVLAAVLAERDLEIEELAHQRLEALGDTGGAY
jgi:CBS domain-containing protein